MNKKKWGDGMMIHCCVGVSEDCINHYSYGEICVHCGCCSKNKNYWNRVIRIIRYYKDCLRDEMNFSYWDDNEKWRKIQEKNVASNILYYKRKIRLYKKILRSRHEKEGVI